MRKIFIFLLLLLPLSLFSEQNTPKKIILLISEQNIEGPQRAWWVSEIDLSTVETVIAKKLISEGFEIIQPNQVFDKIKYKPAFRIVEPSDEISFEIAKDVKADYILVGKAVASAGGRVINSNMRSCFANITAKLLRLKDKKVLNYFDASASVVHLDVITGGKEALTEAANILSQKIIDELKKEGGVKE